MTALARAYTAAITGLAVLAAALLAAVFIMIVYDVAVRTLGFQPPYWTSALTEYALLFMTMLAAPWLVRIRGHVFVESLTLVMPPGMRRFVAKLVYALCIALCLLLSYYGARIGWDAFLRGDYDIRSIDMPRWILFSFLPIGLIPSAVEFGRYLLGVDDMYAGRGTTTEGF